MRSLHRPAGRITMNYSRSPDINYDDLVFPIFIKVAMLHSSRSLCLINRSIVKFTHLLMVLPILPFQSSRFSICVTCLLTVILCFNFSMIVREDSFCPLHALNFIDRISKRSLMWYHSARREVVKFKSVNWRREGFILIYLFSSLLSILLVLKLHLPNKLIPVPSLTPYLKLEIGCLNIHSFTCLFRFHQALTSFLWQLLISFIWYSHVQINQL